MIRPDSVLSLLVATLMIRPRLVVLLVVVLLLSTNIHAAACVRLVVAEGQVVTVEAGVTESTHLTLPEPIRKDVVGSPGLWDAHHDQIAPDHYWIRPKNMDEPIAQSTSLTLLTPSRSYDFILLRAAEPRSTCYVIDEDVPLGVGAVLPVASTAPQGAEPAAWFTRYEWKSALIESVYDDGRFTYVRLEPRVVGLEIPVLQGGTKRKPILIEAKYDASSRTYRVSGVHDELTLVSGRDAIRIRRQS